MELERSECSRQLEALRVDLLTKEQALEKLQTQLSIISTLNEAAILADEKEKTPPPLPPPSDLSGAPNSMPPAAANANGSHENAAPPPSPSATSSAPTCAAEALTLQRQRKQLELKYAAALKQIYGTTLELKRYGMRLQCSTCALSAHPLSRLRDYYRASGTVNSTSICFGCPLMLRSR